MLYIISHFLSNVVLLYLTIDKMYIMDQDTGFKPINLNEALFHYIDTFLVSGTWQMKPQLAII